MKKELKQEIGQLLMMCFKANSNKGYNVFFDYAGHVDNIKLMIFKKGVEDAVFVSYVYVKGTLFDGKELKKELKKWKEELMKIINPVFVFDEV